MSPSWTTVAVIGGTLQGLCLAADQLLLQRQKEWIYDRLLTLWDKLADTRFKNYPALLAEWINKKGLRLFGSRIFSLRSACFTMLISVLLNVAVLLVLHEWEWGNTLTPDDTDSWDINVHEYFWQRNWFTLLSITTLADFASIYLTRVCIDKIRKSGAIGFQICNMAGSAMIAFLELRCLGDYCLHSLGLHELFTLPCIVLIPVLSFQLLLFGMALVRVTGLLVSRLVMHFAEVATEQEARQIAPFTLLATVVNVFVLLGKATAYFLNK
jgi:hypothetical protein